LPATHRIGERNGVSAGKTRIARKKMLVVTTAMPYNVCMRVFRTRTYEKKLVKLLRHEEIFAKEQVVLMGLESWPVIAGTGGVRKARVAIGASGKSGGLRILYYFWVGAHAVYFLDVYAKNEKENITAADKKMLKQFIQTLIDTE
jgi:hypothetical protein